MTSPTTEIRDLLRQHPGMTIEEIRAESGYAYNTTRRILLDLGARHDGGLPVTDHRRWRLMDCDMRTHADA